MTPPTSVASTRPEVVTEGLPARRPAWVERATSADHKSVGMLYVGASLSFLALSTVELALIRLQLIVPENTTIRPEIFDRILSTFGITAVVLFAIPLALGLIGFVTPLQIGSRGVAFPRLNLLSFWLYLAGAVTVYASYIYRPTEAGLAILGFVCFAVNLVATLHGMRAPGMAWRRVPILSWAAALSGYLLLVIGPAMLAALTMLFIDRHFGGAFFDSGEGGAPLLYEHLAWLFFTGAYVLIVIVAGGVISDVLPTFARKPLFSHRGAMVSLLAVAVLGPLAWMQNMYTAPIPLGFEIFAMLFALALAVPIGLLIFNWVATLWDGALRLRAAPAFALGAIGAMTTGLAGELVYSVLPVGWQLDDTAAAQGATFSVLAGGAVLGGFGGLHYWFPKLTGRMMGEAAGKASLVLTLAGIYVYGLFTFFAGVKGQPADIYKFYEGYGLDGFNLVASVSAFVFVAGVLLELVNAAYSYGHGVRAGHDPWGGATLEWFALSPPPEHNFDVVPDVRSAEPLYDIRRAVRERTEPWRPPIRERVPEPAREGEPVEASAGDSGGESRAGGSVA